MGNTLPNVRGFWSSLFSDSLFMKVPLLTERAYARRKFPFECRVSQAGVEELGTGKCEVDYGGGGHGRQTVRCFDARVSGRGFPPQCAERDDRRPVRGCCGYPSPPVCGSADVCGMPWRDPEPRMGPLLRNQWNHMCRLLQRRGMRGRRVLRH